MTDPRPPEMSWAERAAERSPMVQRSRARGVEQARAIVEAAQRLIATKGSGFTTQELVKEAGIALQTFYRYFGGKDQLILAVIENMVTEEAVRFREAVREVDDPVARLRYYVTSIVKLLADSGDRESPRFLATEHWRLQALYPEEIARASKSYTDLLQEEIDAAVAAGLLQPADPAYAAWLVTQLVRAVFHYYAFVAPDEPYDVIAGRVWDFCVAGLGGQRDQTVDSRPRTLKRVGSRSR
jgi:AcrR family transcriptional regulator